MLGQLDGLGGHSHMAITRCAPHRMRTQADTQRWFIGGSDTSEWSNIENMSMRTLSDGGGGDTGRSVGVPRSSDACYPIPFERVNELARVPI